MRYTILPNMHLSRLPRSTRVLLTLFVLSIDVGLWVGSLKYTQRAEFTPAGATRYWHGESSAAGDPVDLLDPGAPPPSEQKSTRFLVDVVHPHLFTVPIVLFILLHLLLLTRLSEGAKIGLHVHAFLSFAATFSLPFLVSAKGSGAALFVVAGANLLLSFVVVSAILLYETWRPAASAPRVS
jgi:hypothetical protein